jgi:hypothetical protein
MYSFPSTKCFYFIFLQLLTRLTQRSCQMLSLLFTCRLSWSWLFSSTLSSINLHILTFFDITGPIGTKLGRNVH